MGKYKYTLIASSILSLLVGCGGSSSETVQQTETNTEPTPVNPAPAPESGTSEQEEQNKDAKTLNSIEIQVIDGYLTGIDVCIVDHTKLSLPCDSNFAKAKSSLSGDVTFALTDEQKNILVGRSFIKVKAVAPKGTRDIIFGEDTNTQQDLILLGTIFTDGASENISYKLTPFTTMVEMMLRNNGEEPKKADYDKALQDVANSLGVDVDVIQSDYNNPVKKTDPKAVKAVIAGETVSNLNYLPKNDEDLSSSSQPDMVAITEKLGNEVQPLVEQIAESGVSADKIAETIAGNVEELQTAYKKSYVSISTGIADDWRCAVNKANEVLCWGNNAWNNLGNPQFTAKKSEGEFTNGHTGDMAYLVGNSSADLLNVQIRNPNKTKDDDPEFVDLTGVSKVMTGNAHGCAITITGEVYCWGSNSSGQLGWGKVQYKAENKSIGYASKVVTGAQGAKSGFLSNVVDLSLGVDHSCALTSDGDIYCWGDNTALELGDEFTKERIHQLDQVKDANANDISDKIWIVTDPVKLPAGNVKFSKISKSGQWAHCALSTPETTDKEGHNLWCWGDDNYGLVSGQNWKYVDPDYPYAESSQTNNWYYVANNKLGAMWPMHGQKLTNVKSIMTHEINYVCPKNKEISDELSNCTKVLTCNNSGVYYAAEDTGYDNPLYLTEEQKCAWGYSPFINIKAMDISTPYYGRTDSLIVYTSDEKTIYLAETDSTSMTRGNPPDSFVAPVIFADPENEDYSAGTFNDETIKNIRLSSMNGITGFVTTEEGNLWGFGEQDYGLMTTDTVYGNNHYEGNEAKGIEMFNSQLYRVHDVSVNGKSVCAIVSLKSNKSQQNIWCWGSVLFDQLALDHDFLNYDSLVNFSFGEALESFIISDHFSNEYYIPYDRILAEPTPVGEELFR